jgi:mono/diheme cytochrome c family protein
MTTQPVALLRMRAIATCLFASLVILACSGSPEEAGGEPVDPAVYDAGQALYGEFCSSCHGSDGRGGVGPALSSGRAGELDSISMTIREGGDQMPGLEARLTSEQVAAIAQYVHDLL